MMSPEWIEEERVLSHIRAEHQLRADAQKGRRECLPPFCAHGAMDPFFLMVRDRDTIIRRITMDRDQYAARSKALAALRDHLGSSVVDTMLVSCGIDLAALELEK